MAFHPPDHSPSSDAPSSLSRVAAWLQVLRLPRLLLAPAAVIAGYAIASNGFATVVFARLTFAAGGALALYAGANLLNAWWDCYTDQQLHPRWALPAGVLTPRAVQLAGLLALIIGNLLWWMGGLSVLPGLIVLIVLAGYLFITHPALTWIKTVLRAIGHCLLLLVGGLAAGIGEQRTVLILMAVGMLSVFMLLIDRLRRAWPSKQKPPAWLCYGLYLSPVLLLVTGVEGIFGGGWTCAGVWAIWALFTYTTIVMGRQLRRLRNRDDLLWYEDALLRNLVFMYAFWTAAAGASCFAVCLVLLLWPASSWLHRLSE